MEKLNDVLVRILEKSWNARAAAIKAAGKIEEAPRDTGSTQQRAQDASLAGEESRRLRKVE